MKWRWSFILLIVGFSSCTRVQNHDHPCKLPLHFLSCSDAPMLEINIEDVPRRVMFDLGANVCLMLQKNVLDQIDRKEYLGSSRLLDINGNEYFQPNFRIAPVQIGPMRIDNPVATEENPYFVLHGNTIRKGDGSRSKDRIEQVDGKIGSELFYVSQSICGIDLSHSVLYVGKSLEEIRNLLPKSEYWQQDFEVIEGFVCIDLQTNLGKKRFLLDTGSEMSVITKGLVDDNEAELWLDLFGKWYFYSVPFPDSLPPFDGILGVDFMKKHAFCLDFSSKTALIQIR